MTDQLSINAEGMRPAVDALVSTLGWNASWTFRALAGGANNRVYRLDGADGDCALLKFYFQHSRDSRDRLGAEFSFSQFAWDNGVRRLPRPLARDMENRLGLYEFIEGRPLLYTEVTMDCVQQALDFYHEVNRHRMRTEAIRLPLASEACFSLIEHLQCVARRVRRLERIDVSSAIEKDAASFIRSELLPVTERVEKFATERVVELGLSMDEPVAHEDRRLSPSDFGFHNAIRPDVDDRLRFIDFEYAGWDDPAKLVCDFFCQPAVPVPLKYLRMFTEAVIADLTQPEIHRQRIEVLLPVYRIKWCCILLNDFLPAGNERRQFARDATSQEERKAEQLGKARRALQQLVSEMAGKQNALAE